MKSLCQVCKQYRTCKRICELIEAYVNQDYMPLKELAIPYPIESTFEYSSSTYLTKKEKQILTLLGSGLDRREIAEVLKTKRETIRTHIYNIKKKS